MEDVSDKPVRVLLVEDNPGDARLLEETLKQAVAGEFHLEYAEQLSEAVDALAHEQFDVVLLDLVLPDSQGLEALLGVSTAAPDVAIVVLSGLDDETLAAEAVEAGAQDYLIKGHVDPEAMVRSIRYAILRQRARAQRLHRQEGRGMIMGFIGAKGGVGTTTVALNAASALCEQNRIVAAAELRPCFGTFSVQLRQTPAENLSHLLDLDPEATDASEVNARLVRLPHGLSVLFGPQQVDEFGEIGPEHAEALIKALADIAEYVVIDLPCYPSSANEAALRACDVAGLIVAPDAPCIESAKVTLSLLESWGVGRQGVRIVIVNRVGLLTALPLDHIRAELGCEIVGVVPPAIEPCLRAQQSGIPLVLDEPESVAALNLAELTERLATGQVMAVD